MSNKFEQLLDFLVNEEMDKANELFHEIVVEKSREIYENLIAEEAQEEEMDESADEEMDEAAEEDDEELDEELSPPHAANIAVDKRAKPSLKWAVLSSCAVAPFKIIFLSYYFSFA
jgi:hypothetical protein